MDLPNQAIGILSLSRGPAAPDSTATSHTQTPCRLSGTLDLLVPGAPFLDGAGGQLTRLVWKAPVAGFSGRAPFFGLTDYLTLHMYP